MLFHVAMTHSVENCPLYLPAKEKKKSLADMEKMFGAAKQQNIDIRFMVTGVGHVGRLPELILRIHGHKTIFGTVLSSHVMAGLDPAIQLSVTRSQM